MENSNYKNAVWFWNKKPVKISNLDHNQITHIIKNVLSKNNKGNNFGLSNEYWLKSFQQLSIDNESKEIDNISKYLIDKKQLAIETIIDKIINKNINKQYTCNGSTKRVPIIKRITTA